MIHIHEEAARCLLCENAPCTKACKKGDPARAIQAIRFDNEKNALRWLKDCSEADLLAAEKACIHYDQPLRIRELLKAVEVLGYEEPDTLPDLGITFCGIPCESPFFLASSAVSTNYDMIARAFKAGWAGVFYKTICKMDIQEVSPRFDAVGKKLTSFIGFRNMEQLSEHVYTEDLEIMRRLKKDFPTKVVIASIMGKYEEEWIELAKLAEEAGCDAVELNFSCPQMRLAGTGSDVGQDTELVACYTTYVKQNVHIPVIPKMTPNITNINHPAMGAYFAGADAVSAINTIKSITMSRKAMVNGKKTISGYSGRAVKPIALRFIHDMAKNKIMKGLELSGIGGIETWTDALDFIMLGCRNTTRWKSWWAWNCLISCRHQSSTVRRWSIPRLTVVCASDVAVAMCLAKTEAIRPSLLATTACHRSMERNAWVATSADWFVPLAPLACLRGLPSDRKIPTPQLATVHN